MTVKTIFSIKYIVLFILLFIILYFEHTYIGPIKISQIWKVPFYVYFIHYILENYNTNRISVPNYVFYSFLLFFLLVVNTTEPRYYFYNLSEAFTNLTLPLSIAYFEISSRNRANNVELFVISFSSFLILYNVPYILNILPDVNASHDLSKYGLENKSMLTGAFIHTNISSKINLIATLTVMFSKKYFDDKIIKKISYWFLIALGSYSIYLNFTRTGWILFLFGIFFILFYKERIKRLILIATPLMFGVILLTFVFIANNPAIMLRLLGETTYRTNESYDSNQISSGRLEIWENAIENLKKDGIAAVVLGHGVKRALFLMEKSYGYSLVAHNRFIEILQFSGIIGLLLYLKVLHLIFKQVKKIRIVSGDYHSKLPLTIFLILIISAVPSHGLPLWSEIIFGGLIVGQYSNQ